MSGLSEAARTEQLTGLVGKQIRLELVGGTIVEGVATAFYTVKRIPHFRKTNDTWEVQIGCLRIGNDDIAALDVIEQ